MLKGRIENWEKFKETIPDIKKLIFMGDIFTEPGEILENAREAYLIKEDVEFSY